MEVLVVAPSFRCSSFEFPPGSVVRDVLERFIPHQDWYVTTNGRLSGLEERLQDGAVYRLEPRLRGGKGGQFQEMHRSHDQVLAPCFLGFPGFGSMFPWFSRFWLHVSLVFQVLAPCFLGFPGFGSMLRALGAQIEKTTNREACRDLSGRRLRDVNHEKEMADWLKKQSEREAEKEQRRLERLQRKLLEPRHQFADPQYQQQCHDLSERLEDSVLKGLQATSSGQVKVGVDPDQNRAPARKRRKTAAAAGFWTGLDELLSSEDDEDDESPCSGGAVTMTTQREEAEPGPSSSTAPTARTSEVQNPGLPTEPAVGPSGDQNPPQGCREPAQVQNPGLPTEPAVGPSGDQNPPQGCREPAQVQNPGLPMEPAVGPSGDQNPPQGCREPAQVQNPGLPTEPAVGPSGDQNPPQGCREPDQLDLSSVPSVQQLESLGLEVLKEELMRRGLKCGGTLSERAARLYSVRGLSPDRIDPALLARTRRK
ncbi:protein SDE2 homolog isoform X2 [Xiphophorus maculatus]|uniref:protein SDE2 homolog isoform X2 n=1 Tax=Xiphophorus maculatus TaxID=8083 RepID=UPI000C6E00AC|nr:protein SDE2 homolog isoform X2 [Xiphophorus maculatus]